MLAALRQCRDREHRDVAADLAQVIDQGRERGVDMPQPHAQLARQLGRQVDVEPAELAGLGIAVADAVVVRPDAHPQLAPALDLLERVGTSASGLRRRQQQGAGQAEQQRPHHPQQARA